MNNIILKILITASIFYILNAKDFQLSTHALDSSTGQPIDNLKIELYKMNNNNTQNWDKLQSVFTNKQGRYTDLLPIKNNNQGIYKIRFYTKEYFDNKHIQTLYPYIEIIFELKGNEHYHIPITVSPFGYSTYKGS